MSEVAAAPGTPGDVHPGRVGRIGRKDAGELAVVSFSHAVQHVYVAGLAVAYPFVVAGFHVSYGALGVILGVSGVLGGLLQGVAGILRRHSARLLLSVQNLGLAGASLMGALAPFFWFFGASLLLGSAVSWPQHPVGSSVLAERYPERRAYALSWHVAGGSIGTATVPLVVSALIAAAGWRVGVAFLVAPLAAGGAIVAWRLRPPPVPRETAAVPKGQHLRELRALVRRREVVVAVVAGTIAAGGRGLGVLSVFVPAYLRSGLHFAPVTIGVLFTVLLIGSIGGPLVAGRVADRLGRRRVLVVVYMVAAATIAGFVSVGSGYLALGIVGLLVGIFAYSEAPLLQSVFSEGLRGLEQRSAFGYYFAISYGVGSLWTIALGFIVDRAGFRWAFFVMAASFVAAGLVVWAFRPRHRAGPGHEGAADPQGGAGAPLRP